MKTLPTSPYQKLLVLLGLVSLVALLVIVFWWNVDRFIPNAWGGATQ